MEGLRGYAVFLVFLVHYVTFVSAWIEAAAPVGIVAEAIQVIGNTGVDLFFVLSGYLIYGSLIVSPRPFGRFMARRVQRIYPAFIVVFMIYLVLSLVFLSEDKIPSHPIAAAAYLIGNLLLLPGLFPIEPMITVAWSLSYEMCFYLMVPLVVASAGLRNWTARGRTTLFAVAGVLICLLGEALPGTLGRMSMFVWGIMLWEALARWTKPTASTTLAISALAAGYLVTLVPTIGPTGAILKIAVLGAALFVLCFTCFADPNGSLARAFSWTPLRWFGNMSYSVLPTARSGSQGELRGASTGATCFATRLVAVRRAHTANVPVEPHSDGGPLCIDRTSLFVGTESRDQHRIPAQ